MMVRIISIHIPKTAGTAFGRVLEQVVRPDQIDYDYDDYVLDPAAQFQRNAAAWQQETAARVRRLPPHCQVIHGHFSASKYTQHFPEACWITWLRQPVARLISHYFYWKHRPPVAGRSHSLHERVWQGRVGFAELVETPVMQNVVTRVFLRGLPVERCYFIGVQERFGADLRRLQRALNWPELAIPSNNENGYPGYREAVDALMRDASLVRRIEQLNGEDLELYERVLGRQAAVCQR